MRIHNSQVSRYKHEIVTIKKSKNLLPSSKPPSPIHISSQSRACVKLCSAEQVLWSKFLTYLCSKHHVQCENEDGLIVVLEGGI